jgi:hypothetical protein
MSATKFHAHTKPADYGVIFLDSKIITCTRTSVTANSVDTYNYKVVQIWPGQTVTCLHTNSPGHIWTTLYKQGKLQVIRDKFVAGGTCGGGGGAFHRISSWLQEPKQAVLKSLGLGDTRQNGTRRSVLRSRPRNNARSRRGEAFFHTFSHSST